MRNMVFKVLLLVLMAMSLQNTSGAEDYRLGPRDVLAISVWGYEDLQVKDLSVRDDGKIAFPLAGELQVNGLSPAELSQKITLALQGYVNNPQVTVNVIKFRTSRVYVLGEINHPGVYEIEKQHRLLDAIGIAGGYTKDAAKKKVFIIRKDSVDKPLEANLLSLLKKGDMTQNYVLGDGDVVYLSDNGRIDFTRDVLPYINTALYIKDIND